MSDYCTQMATKPSKEVNGPDGRFDRNQEAARIFLQPVESGRCPISPSSTPTAIGLNWAGKHQQMRSKRCRKRRETEEFGASPEFASV